MKGPYAVIIVENGENVIAETVPLAKGRKNALKIVMAKNNMNAHHVDEAYVFKGVLPTPFVAEVPPPIKPRIIRKRTFTR